MRPRDALGWLSWTPLVGLPFDEKRERGGES